MEHIQGGFYSSLTLLFGNFVAVTTKHCTKYSFCAVKCRLVYTGIFDKNFKKLQKNIDDFLCILCTHDVNIKRYKHEGKLVTND